jgi:hypothetical protein
MEGFQHFVLAGAFSRSVFLGANIKLCRDDSTEGDAMARSHWQWRKDNLLLAPSES